MTASNIQYALVARGTTPLAEFSVVQGNARATALRMLETIDPSKRNMVEQANGTFLSQTDPDRITFLCLTDRQINAKTGYAFLDELRAKWRARYQNSGASFAPNSKNSEFGQTEIATLMRQYNAPSSQKLNQIKANLDATKDTMTQNLSMALTRGENLTTMEGKAEDIRSSAATFRREAEKVRCAQCCAKWRWYILGIAILLVVIVVILMIACKPNFSSCKGGDSSQ
jgi:vesicle-associated membrane protein 7